MLRIGQIKLPYKVGDDQVFGYTLKKLHIQEKDVLNWRIFKKSIDARKEEIMAVYTIDIELKKEASFIKKK